MLSRTQNTHKPARAHTHTHTTLTTIRLAFETSGTIYSPTRRHVPPESSAALLR